MERDTQIEMEIDIDIDMYVNGVEGAKGRARLTSGATAPAHEACLPVGSMLPGVLQDLLRSAAAGVYFALLSPSCPSCPSPQCGSITCPEVHCGACEMHSPPASAALHGAYLVPYPVWLPSSRSF